MRDGVDCRRTGHAVTSTLNYWAMRLGGYKKVLRPVSFRRKLSRVDLPSMTRRTASSLGLAVYKAEVEKVNGDNADIPRVFRFIPHAFDSSFYPGYHSPQPQLFNQDEDWTQPEYHSCVYLVDSCHISIPTSARARSVRSARSATHVSSGYTPPVKYNKSTIHQLRRCAEGPPITVSYTNPRRRARHFQSG